MLREESRGFLKNNWYNIIAFFQKGGDGMDTKKQIFFDRMYGWYKMCLIVVAVIVVLCIFWRLLPGTAKDYIQGTCQTYIKSR